jgi:hypothetical protein
MAITALSVTQSGDRSFSASFTSAAATDILTFASLAAELTDASSIFAFVDGAPSLADFAAEGVACSLASDPTVDGTASGVGVVATGFNGFVAGSHVLRVSLPYSASA